MSMSPIGEIITQRMNTMGLTPEKLVKLVGYYHLPKGLKMLDDLISGKATAYKHTPMVNLTKVLGVSEADLDGALDLAHQQLILSIEDREARRGYYNERTFRPHLWIRTSLSRPTQIFPVAFCGEARFKHIALPEGVVAPDGSYDAETLKNIIRVNYRENEGKVFLFGDIVSYILRWKYGARGIEFSPDGSVLTYDPQPVPQGKVTLSVGHKVIPSGLLDKIISGDGF
jgi:hypothetical protein